MHSPTLDEAPLQQAVLAAINAAMPDHETLVAQITDAMEQELAPIPGEGMSLGDIDRATEELGKQFDNLLLEASNALNTEEYAERFRAISNMIEELKCRKANILQIRQEQEQIERRMHAATTVMNMIPSELTEWDDNIVYQMLEKVSVLSREKIRVTFEVGRRLSRRSISRREESLRDACSGGTDRADLLRSSGKGSKGKSGAAPLFPLRLCGRVEKPSNDLQEERIC